MAVEGSPLPPARARRVGWKADEVAQVQPAVEPSGGDGTGVASKAPGAGRASRLRVEIGEGRRGGAAWRGTDLGDASNLRR